MRTCRGMSSCFIERIEADAARWLGHFGVLSVLDGYTRLVISKLLLEKVKLLLEISDLLD